MAGTAYGSVILTAGESVRLVLSGRRSNGGADIWGEIALERDAAAALPAGRSLSIPGRDADEVRVVDGEASVSYPLKRTLLSVETTGHFAMLLELAGTEAVEIHGRLLGACEHIDENSSLRHVVDPANEPACAPLVDWL
jgi:hypothetical protein